MTLDEAIKNAEEIADKKEREKQKWEKWLETDSDYRAVTEKVSCELCAEEHRQLAEWLRELKHYKDCQDLINKSWQELINYKEGIEKIKMRSQAYRERGETALASGMKQALDILKEVNANDVELVIKMPEDTYKDIVKNGFIYDEDNEVVTHAIKNGTPLPKGHGRLIDANALTIKLKAWDINTNGIPNYAWKCIKDIPTIIEADKEYEAEVITRGKCMMCGKELTEGLFFCKECEAKAESEDKE